MTSWRSQGWLPAPLWEHLLLEKSKEWPLKIFRLQEWSISPKASVQLKFLITGNIFCASRKWKQSTCGVGVCFNSGDCFQQVEYGILQVSENNWLVASTRFREISGETTPEIINIFLHKLREILLSSWRICEAGGKTLNFSFEVGKIHDSPGYNTCPPSWFSATTN